MRELTKLIKSKDTKDNRVLVLHKHRPQPL